MAIDPMIALQIQPVRVQDPLQAMYRAQQSQAMAQRNAAGALEMQDAVAQRQRVQQLRDLMARMDPNLGAKDRATQLTKGGFYTEGQGILKADAEQRKLDSEITENAAQTANQQAQAGKHQLEQVSARLGAMGQMLSGVRDPQGYAQVRQSIAQQLGPEAAAQLPEQFDPGATQAWINRAMSVKDQVDAQQKQATLAETVRNNDMDNRIAQGQLGIAGQNVRLRGAELGQSRQRLEFDKNQARQGQIVETGDGQTMLVNRYTGQAQPVLGQDGQPVFKGKAASEHVAENRRANEITQTFGEIEKLLPQATGSYAGKAYDEAWRAVGETTDGAKANARLQVLSSQILMSRPRFEGPQGVLDVKLYEQAAGRLADPTVPTEERIAAFNDIKAITKRQQEYTAKYAPGAQQVQQGQAASAGGGDLEDTGAISKWRGTMGLGR